MPNLQVRKANEVPSPSRSPRAVREQQALYEGFIRQIDGNVGELEPGSGENVRSIKMRLRRAASRIGFNIDIWDADGKVYFQAARPRGRPMFTAEVQIHLKRGVADPEGANTLKTLRLLGFEKIRDVHTVKLFTLDVDADDEDEAHTVVEQACRRLLANPVIQDYTITLRRRQETASA
jgi:phosphoribosylformylglycinamidine synthase subunit PurS